MDPRKVNGGVFSASTALSSRATAAPMPEGYASAIELAYDMVKNELTHKIAQDLVHYHRGRFAEAAPTSEGDL
jgi:glycerol-3-phosphate acyltransferase PlsX